MPPAPQQQQPQGGDNSLAALWLTLFIFALLGVIWYFFHVQIVWFIFKLKYLEMLMVSLFNGQAILLAQKLHSYSARAVPVDIFVTMLQDAGKYMRYPFGIILMMLAAILFYVHPALRFKKTHDMKSLYEQEKFNWPQIMPVSKVDLIKEPLDKGPWAMSLTPLQFAKKYRLIIEEREKIISLGGQRQNVRISVARAEAYQVFATQLGPYWMGVERLAMHTKALFAVFASCANHDQDSARKILDQLALSSVSGELDFSGVEELLKKYKDTQVLKQLSDRHAYVMTAMATMVILARQDGVLAAADFLWVKAVDRPLWYMLNSVGRQTAFVEVSGPFAHWLAERKLGRKISVPMVEEAVKALESALKEVMYVPDSEEAPANGQ